MPQALHGYDDVITARSSRSGNMRQCLDCQQPTLRHGTAYYCVDCAERRRLATRKAYKRRTFNANIQSHRRGTDARQRRQQLPQQ